MTLSEYTNAGDKDSFVYWMEGGLDEYGSIWGGSAFKFGICSRNEHSAKQGDGALAYDAEFGWYRRFGSTHDLAFQSVRKEVVAVAEAARNARWAEIDNSELGPSYRWKIAFNYQDRARPLRIPCVFLRQPLLHARKKGTEVINIYLRPFFCGLRRSHIFASRCLWRPRRSALPLYAADPSVVG